MDTESASTGKEIAPKPLTPEFLNTDTLEKLEKWMNTNQTRRIEQFIRKNLQYVSVQQSQNLTIEEGLLAEILFKQMRAVSILCLNHDLPNPPSTNPATDIALLLFSGAERSYSTTGDGRLAQGDKIAQNFVSNNLLTHSSPEFLNPNDANSIYQRPLETGWDPGHPQQKYRTLAGYDRFPGIAKKGIFFLSEIDRVYPSMIYETLNSDFFRPKPESTAIGLLEIINNNQLVDHPDLARLVKKLSTITTINLHFPQETYKDIAPYRILSTRPDLFSPPEPFSYQPLILNLPSCDHIETCNRLAGSVSALEKSLRSPRIAVLGKHGLLEPPDPIAVRSARENLSRQKESAARNFTQKWGSVFDQFAENLPPHLPASPQTVRSTIEKLIDLFSADPNLPAKARTTNHAYLNRLSDTNLLQLAQLPSLRWINHLRFYEFRDLLFDAVRQNPNSFQHLLKFAAQDILTSAFSVSDRNTDFAFSDNPPFSSSDRLAKFYSLTTPKSQEIDCYDNSVLVPKIIDAALEKADLKVGPQPASLEQIVQKLKKLWPHETPTTYEAFGLRRHKGRLLSDLETTAVYLTRIAGVCAAAFFGSLKISETYPEAFSFIYQAQDAVNQLFEFQAPELPETASISAENSEIQTPPWKKLYDILFLPTSLQLPDQGNPKLMIPMEITHGQVQNPTALPPAVRFVPSFNQLKLNVDPKQLVLKSASPTPNKNIVPPAGWSISQLFVEGSSLSATQTDLGAIEMVKPQPYILVLTRNPDSQKHSTGALTYVGQTTGYSLTPDQTEIERTFSQIAPSRELSAIYLSLSQRLQKTSLAEEQSSIIKDHFTQLKAYYKEHSYYQLKLPDLASNQSPLEWMSAQTENGFPCNVAASTVDEFFSSLGIDVVPQSVNAVTRFQDSLWENWGHVNLRVRLPNGQVFETDFTPSLVDGKTPEADRAALKGTPPTQTQQTLPPAADLADRLDLTLSTTLALIAAIRTARRRLSLNQSVEAAEIIAKEDIHTSLGPDPKDQLHFILTPPDTELVTAVALCLAKSPDTPTVTQIDTESLPKALSQIPSRHEVQAVLSLARNDQSAWLPYQKTPEQAFEFLATQVEPANWPIGLPAEIKQALRLKSGQNDVPIPSSFERIFLLCQAVAEMDAAKLATEVLEAITAPQSSSDRGLARVNNVPHHSGSLISNTLRSHPKKEIPGYSYLRAVHAILSD